jgi:hypothetical protein
MRFNKGGGIRFLLSEVASLSEELALPPSQNSVHFVVERVREKTPHSTYFAGCRALKGLRPKCKVQIKIWL